MKTKLVRTFLVVSLLTMGLLLATPTGACHQTITIKKVVDCGPYSCDQSTDFIFTRSWGTAFILDGDPNDGDLVSNTTTFTDPSVGTDYDVTETWEPDEWSLANIHCESDLSDPDIKFGVAGDDSSFDASLDPDDNTVRINLRCNEDVTCTFTNSYAGATAVTLSSFAAKSSAGLEAPLAWGWLLGVVTLAMGGVLWVRRRSNRLGRTDY